MCFASLTPGGLESDTLSVQAHLSVIVPCFNEADYLPACLNALYCQTLVASGAPFEIIVILNGCTDHSAQVARRLQQAVPEAVRLRIIELPAASKFAALNAGDAVATGPNRVYLDADVICEPSLLESLLAVLDRDEPRYATGLITIMPSRSRLTAAYGKFWLSLVRRDVIGIGLYAVNAKGRTRWEAFPSLHSDDKFVRLNFASEERIRVPVRYYWPLPEGWVRLLKVRLRWTEGNLELNRRYPELSRRHTRAKRPFVYLSLALVRPVSFLAFFSVYIICRLLARSDVQTEGMQWRRGR